MNNFVKLRVMACIKQCLPSTTKTCWWIIKLTVGVSFAMLLLKYFNILPWISSLVDPIFRVIGLPGDAALVYVSGYFVNVYSALAVLSTIDLDARAITILGSMVLCSHSMILETAVQKKTGASGLRMVITRTLGALMVGFFLHWVLPPSSANENVLIASTEDSTFGKMFWEWLVNTLKLILLMTTVIYSLNILQRLLSEFGIIEKISAYLRPVMRFFGLPEKTAFLWIIANLIGLGYGAAAMLDELDRGRLNKREVTLLDSHIGVAHSNLEDLLLVSSAGGTLWIILLVRWGLSLILVWELRAEYFVRDRWRSFVCSSPFKS